jgi:glycosyltransferase involved in cell wall biosynthesis
MGLKSPVIGGWMYGLAEQVASQSHIKLAVVSCYSRRGLRKDVIESITYYTVPFNYHSRYPKELEPFWKMICDEFKPDIIHIHGTEYPRALACIKAYPDCKYVVSIQGMIGPYSRYVLGGISPKSLLKFITIYDILKKDTLLSIKHRWEKMGKLEMEYFNHSNIVIGRTSWDYARVKAINTTCNYKFCNESLRDEFYVANKWSYLQCTKQSIFLSQAGVPLKGLHKVLEAIQLIRDEFPDLTIRIGGNNIIANSTLSDKVRMGGYGKYINSLLRKYRLFGVVEFLGTLDASAMVIEYQNANVFICPSSIENSPNSVGEAQIIGTPVIGSYVGGIPDMITHNDTGFLYRFEEVEMLAEYIRKLFLNMEIALNISRNGIFAAEKRHNKLTNLNKLLEIYSSCGN